MTLGVIADVTLVIVDRLVDGLVPGVTVGLMGGRHAQYRHEAKGQDGQLHSVVLG